MVNSVIDYCKDNNIQFERSEIEIGGLKADLIETIEKKILKKRNNLYFIECNEFDKIESVCRLLAGDKNLKGIYIVVFCKTTLEMTDECTCFMGDNAEQFVYCVYQNTNSNEFTFFIKDLNMPKSTKNIVMSVVEK